jgi:hypothetical protein
MSVIQKMILTIVCFIGMVESFALLCMQGNTIALDWLFIMAMLCFGGATLYLTLTTLLGEPPRARNR